MTLPTCPLTDLPRLFCGCPTHLEWARTFDYDDLTPEERAFFNTPAPEPVPDHIHHVIPITYPAGVWGYGQAAQQGRVPNVLVCDHGRPDGMTLCPDCAAQLERALGDVPALMADLTLAFTKQVRFVENGAPDEPAPEGEEDPDYTGVYTEESPLPYNQTASKATRRLWQALGGEPVDRSRQLLGDWKTTLRHPDLHMLAGRVTAAVASAHQVIDRPPTYMPYGQCPKCHNQIKQERVDPEDPNGRVECPCGYTAALDDHNRAQLDLGENVHYTETELLRVLADGGEPAKRHEVNNLINRQGLPREKGQRRRWVDGRQEPYEVDVYRLGDVRDALSGKPISLTSDQVAQTLNVSTAAVRKMVERGDLKPIHPGARPLRFTPGEITNMRSQR